jgi:hypothetical protein
LESYVCDTHGEHSIPGLPEARDYRASGRAPRRRLHCFGLKTDGRGHVRNESQKKGPGAQMEKAGHPVGTQQVVTQSMMRRHSLVFNGAHSTFWTPTVATVPRRRDRRRSSWRALRQPSHRYRHPLPASRDGRKPRPPCATRIAAADSMSDLAAYDRGLRLDALGPSCPDLDGRHVQSAPSARA